MSGSAETKSGGQSMPRDLVILCAAFFFIFMGPGATQAFLNDLLGPGWRTAVLAVVYGMFLFWRIFVTATVSVLGDYVSIVAGGATYVMFAAGLWLSRGDSTSQRGLLLALAALWGWGAASMWIVSSAQILDVTQKHRFGRASGIFYMTLLAGQGIGILLLERVRAWGEAYRSAAWAQDAQCLVATGLGLVGLVFFMFVPRREGPRESFSPKVFAEMVGSRKVMLLGVFLFASSLSYGLLLGPFQDWVKALGGTQWLGRPLACFFAVKSALSLTGGTLSDRFGRSRVLQVGFWVSAGGTILAACWGHLLTLALCALSLGIQSAVVPAAAMATIGDSTSPERRQLAFGAVFVYRDLGVVAGLLVGWMLVALPRGWGWPALSFPVCLAFFGLVFLACGFLAGRLHPLEDQPI